MKKTIRSLAFIATLVCSASVFAQQQLPNQSFENWDNAGTQDEEPVEWNGMMSGDMCFLCSFGQQQTIYRESGASNVHSGTYSVKIETGSYAGQGINGNLTLGRVTAPNATPSNGYNQSLTSGTEFSEAFTDKPDSLVFWAKYIPNGSDSARVSIDLHGNYDQRDPYQNDPNTNSNIVAFSQLNFRTGGNWKRISVPFNYCGGPQNTPAYILVNITSTKTPGNSGGIGSVLYVDDTELVYNTGNPSNSIAPTAQQNIIENQNGTTLTASDNGAASREWKYATASGGPYQSFGTAETGATYTPNFATAGTYYVICESQYCDKNATVATSSEVEIVVSAFTNSIAPTAQQNIDENVAGNQLTVTENATPDSREWKYGTASGGPYQSFSPTETGLNYTPLFATAGTYYVVCESTLSGNTVTSNEVEVVVSPSVTPSVSIAPTSSQNIQENDNGTMLTATEANGTANTLEWKYSTTSGSGYQSFSPSETGNTYTPNFASAGTYYVICEADFSGNVVISNEVEIVVTPAATNTVTVSPSTDQQLTEGQNGTQLTATESPSAASSREWKYSTTSGSGYQSFSPAETATTYTPMFTTAGTYYVVCESDFSGSPVVSNEVLIDVLPLGIEENGELNNMTIYSYGNRVVMDASMLTNNSYQFNIVTVSGQTVLSSSIKGGERKELTTDFAEGVYIINVFNDNTQKQVKLFIK